MEVASADVGLHIPDDLSETKQASDRKDSVASSICESNDHGVPVAPYNSSDSPTTMTPTATSNELIHEFAQQDTVKPQGESSMAASKSPSLDAGTQKLSPTITTAPAMLEEDTAQTPPPAWIGLQSPVYRAKASSFEGLMSPRHPNGKRYLGGYLLQRSCLAGGLLKSWKRKYFRLRDHGIVCYKQEHDTAPLFELLFEPQSELTMDGETTGKKSRSLQFQLGHVDVKSGQVAAHKIEMPVYLKAENETDFASWVENVRAKMATRKLAVTMSSVDTSMCDITSEALTSRTEDDDTPSPLQQMSPVARDVSPPQQSSSPPVVDSKTASPALTSSPLDNMTPEELPFRAQYLLMREIGEGSFSIVHRAVSRLTGKLCAVKCCKHSNVLEEEVRILRGLSHPNVIGIEGVFRETDMCYVVMNYMADGDLCDQLIRKQRFLESEARAVIAPVTRGLAYLHRNCILHRDIKPENILLHGDLVKLADFGLAKQLPSTTAMLKRSCGTLEYAAPELLCGRPYGLKSDVFSLGIVLYVLLFGAFPFSIESAAALQQMESFPEGADVRDMSCLDPSNPQWACVSVEAQDVLLRMLCANDADRISAKELLEHPWYRTFVSASSTTAHMPGVGNEEPDNRADDAKTDDDEVHRVNDCFTKGFRELLTRGFDVVKCGKDGSTAPHVTTLKVDFIRNSISWTGRNGMMGFGTGTQDSIKSYGPENASAASSEHAKRGARVIAFKDIQDICEGHSTAAFRQEIKDLPPPELCLSIVCAWRTLDIVVTLPSQREFLWKGLNHVLSQYRQNHPHQLEQQI